MPYRWHDCIIIALFDWLETGRFIALDYDVHTMRKYLLNQKNTHSMRPFFKLDACECQKFKNQNLCPNNFEASANLKGPPQ